MYALDANGKLKTFTASVSGFVIDGMGYGVATIKGHGSVAVTIASNECIYCNYEELGKLEE